MKLFSPMISNKFTNDCQKSCDFIQRFPCKITSNDIIVVTTILNRWNFKKSLETIIPVVMIQISQQESRKKQTRSLLPV